ncbi:hypothetical protein ACFWFQ_07645 [Nocardia salmonicida]|uniref:hypothetical protein n=1 Tax=Nocardia salmonicida TaxID=53431 RepID=UPI00365DE44A
MNTWLKGLARLAITATVAIVVVMSGLVPATAANLDLRAGEAITIGGSHGCTLGFFVINSAGSRFGVTAGHCSDAVGQSVTTEDATIGHVVARRDDQDGGLGGIGAARGYTLFDLAEYVHVTTRFKAVSIPGSGEAMTKYGRTTGVTRGEILGVLIHPLAHDLSVLWGTAYGTYGDSGGPWFGANGALIGMHAGSFDTGDNGTFSGKLAQPVVSVIALIQATAGELGHGIGIWPTT